MGYESSNSLLNLKTVFIVVATLVIRMAISGFLKLIFKLSKKLCDKKLRIVKKIYKKVTDGLYFGAIIGLTLESYLEFLISSYLTLSHPITSTNGDIISVCFASVLASLAIIFIPIASIFMIFQNKETLEKKSVEKVWGELYFDVNVSTPAKRAFRFTHVIKALVFVLTSFVFRDQNCL